MNVEKNTRLVRSVDDHQMECILNHEVVGEHDCVLVCTKCGVCRHGKPWTNCGTCGDVWAWEEKAEHLTTGV
jgi:hypothetical protein